MLRPNNGPVYTGAHSRLYKQDTYGRSPAYKTSVVECEIQSAESMCNGGAGNPLGLGSINM